MDPCRQDFSCFFSMSPNERSCKEIFLSHLKESHKPPFWEKRTVLSLTLLVKAKEVRANACRHSCCSNSILQLLQEVPIFWPPKASVIPHKEVFDLAFSMIYDTILNYYQNDSPSGRDKDCRRKRAGLQPLRYRVTHQLQMLIFSFPSPRNHSWFLNIPITSLRKRLP